MKAFKLIAWIFFYIAPLTLGFFAFYEGQETKVAWSFTGIFTLLITFLVLYTRFKSWYKDKRQAHETARNLGQLSHTTNFIGLGVANLTFMAIPLLIVMLLDNVIADYDGDLSVWIGYILLSWGVATFFNIMFDYSEQKKIKDKEITKQKEETDKLIQEIKGRL